MTGAVLVDQRLDTLPPKVSLPFKRLLEAGQLNPEALSTILDAGELAGVGTLNVKLVDEKDKKRILISHRLLVIWKYAVLPSVLVAIISFL